MLMNVTLTPTYTGIGEEHFAGQTLHLFLSQWGIFLFTNKASGFF